MNTSIQIIAEIGTSHGGDICKAKELIHAAAEAGATAVKFQWVFANEILHPNTGFVALPGGSVRLYDRFKSLEVSPDFFSDCLEYAHKKGILFACTPFGLKSLSLLAQIQPDAIKIASPEVNHTPLLAACAAFYGKIPLILSSGVSTLGDIEKAILILTKNEAASTSLSKPLSLLHCITSYPAPESEYNVKCVKTLRAVLGIHTGISDHSLDPVLVPSLTVAMGGTIIEKHITLSRETDGLDDPVALEPEMFAQMSSAVHNAAAIVRRAKNAVQGTSSDLEEEYAEGRAAEEIVRQLSEQYGREKVLLALGSGVKKLAPSEAANYGRTNRSLHYLAPLKKGEKLLKTNVEALRTEKVLTPGIAPEFLDVVEGAVLSRDVENGAGLVWEDFLQF